MFPVNMGIAELLAILGFVVLFLYLLRALVQFFVKQEDILCV